MPPTRVVDVLAEVFRTYGFDTTAPAQPEGASGQTHDVDLLAERAGMDVHVYVHAGTDPLGPETLAAHEATVADCTGMYALVVSIPGFTDRAHAHAAGTRTILWDRADVEAMVGKAVLHEVLDPADEEVPVALILAPARGQPNHDRATAPPSDPVIPIGAPAELADPFLLAGFAPEAPVAAAQIVEAHAPPPPTLDLFDMPIAEPTRLPVASPVLPPQPAPAKTNLEEGMGWVLQTGPGRLKVNASRPTPPPAPTAPMPSAASGMAALASSPGLARLPRSRGPDPRTFNPPEGALLAPIISKEKAAGIARDRVFTIDNTQLRYHPKRVLRWEVEAFVEGQVRTTTLSGWRVVDLATRAVEAPKEWTASRSLREGTFDVAVDHKPVRIDEEKARNLALDSILQETAREIVVQDSDSSSDVMMTVKKRVRATREDVQLHDEGLQWCPVWCFTGVNGEVEIDGLFGRVLTESLRSARSGTVVL